MLKGAAWKNTQKTLKSLQIWIWVVVPILLFLSLELVNWLISKSQKAGFNSASVESIEWVGQSILFEPVAIVVPTSLAFFSWVLSVLGGGRAKWISSVSETLLKLSQNVLGATTWYSAGMMVANLSCKNYSIAVLLVFSLALSFLFTFLSHWLESRITSNKVEIPFWWRILFSISAVLLWISALLFLIQGSAAPNNLIYFVPLVFCALFSYFLIWTTTRRL